MMICLNSKSTHRGFTLLEVLVSIFLFAVMTLGIASTLKETTKLTRKLKSREETILSAQIAFDRLQRDLQQAFDENVQRSASLFQANDRAGGPEILFSSLDSDLKILFKDRTPGLVLLHYTFEKGDEGTYNLLRSEVPFFAGDKVQDELSQVVARGITEMKVEYYDGQNDVWQKEWDTKNAARSARFPKAIRLQIQVVDLALPEADRKAKSLSLLTEFFILNEMETR